MSIWKEKKQGTGDHALRHWAGVGVLALCLAAGAVSAQDDAITDDIIEDDPGDVHEDGALPQMTVETAPVQADVALNCAFATECYEAEGCQDSGFGFLLDGHGGGLDQGTLMMEAVIASDAGDVFMMGARDAGAYVLSGGGFDARHMLTVAPDGAARYTVHYSDGPVMVSYLGQCVGAE
ncbi:hypothetical protein ACN2XU_17930 [Primorskyibacter sp. 2E107]|uniref:hypothetical protein n=1 Tax=Primorskyibacter sp. 2E107 TaxID=3403458 RepID=UPI003AF91DD3